MFRRLIGLGLVIALSLFSSVAMAADDGSYGIYGPQTNRLGEHDKYYYFGSPEEPNEVKNGISLTIVEDSISFQTVKAILFVDYGLIPDRSITSFGIMGNRVTLDEVHSYYDHKLKEWKTYYYIDIDVGHGKLGSEIYFQAVGITKDGSGNEYVVAWSNVTPTYKFKPMPVIDRDANDTLREILAVLQAMKASLEGKLDALKQAVEKIYTISPQTQQRFDRSVDNFMDKLPTKQLSDNISNMTDALQRSKQQLKDPNEPLKFGIDKEPDSGNPYVDMILKAMQPFLDLTPWREYVEIFRKFIAAALWVLFFHGLFVRLQPKLNI